VRPSQTVAVVSARSKTASTRNCSLSVPPSVLVRVWRWKRGGEDLLGVGVGQQVAGELLDREAVERQVGVERVDHPVAVAPGVGAVVVLFVAVRVGVARLVEPVAAPALAEVRGRQEPIDEAVDRVRARVARRRRRPRSTRGGSPSRS
jgi:hypothetical protein